MKQLKDNKGNIRDVVDGVFEIIDRDPDKKGVFVYCRFYAKREYDNKKFRIRKTFRVLNNDAQIRKSYDKYLINVYSGKYDDELTLKIKGERNKKKVYLFSTLNTYVENYTKNNKSKKQYQREKTSIAALKKYLKKDRELLSLKRSDAIGFLEWLRHQRVHGGSGILSNATLTKTKGIFSFFFRTYLFDRGLSDGKYNPFERIFYKVIKKQRYIFKEGEFAQIINSCEYQHERTFIALCFYGCLRPGEAMALHWQDVNMEDIENGVITLRAEQTKTKVTRKIAILKPLYIELQKQWSENGSNKLSPYVVWNEAFISGKMSTFEKSMKRLKERLPWIAEVGFTPHGFRHNGATWLLKNGVTLSSISKKLGHTTLAMTERYLHMSEEYAMAEERGKFMVE